MAGRRAAQAGGLRRRQEGCAASSPPIRPRPAAAPGPVWCEARGCERRAEGASKRQTRRARRRRAQAAGKCALLLAPALTHRLGERVLVGAGSDLQAAGRLVVAQPAPAGALHQQGRGGVSAPQASAVQQHTLLPPAVWCKLPGTSCCSPAALNEAAPHLHRSGLRVEGGCELVEAAPPGLDTAQQLAAGRAAVLFGRQVGPEDVVVDVAWGR